MAAVVCALFLMFPSEKTVAVIDGNGAGVTILRGSEVLAAGDALVAATTRLTEALSPALSSTSRS